AKRPVRSSRGRYTGQWGRRLAQGAAAAFGRIRVKRHVEVDDLRDGSSGRAGGNACRAFDHEKYEGAKFPLRLDHRRGRDQRAFPDANETGGATPCGADSDFEKRKQHKTLEGGCVSNDIALGTSTRR